MKRTISMILVAALLLLVALPTFAEGEAALQPGLYVSDSGTDVLYLNETGGGVFSYMANGQYSANGVTWGDGALEIERLSTPYALQADMLIFTYDGAVRIFRYAGAGEDYAPGDRAGTAFAGTYLSAGGQQLTLAADGQGVYTDADGDTAVLWGSLFPYWQGLDNVNENTCYVLFGSFLSGLYFADDQVTLNTETEGDVTLQRQAAAQPAGQGGLYYGYRMTTDGQTMDLVPFLTAMGMDPRDIYLELREDGTGHIQIMDEDSAADFNWTDGALTYEGERVPITWEGDHILLTVEGESIEFAPAAEVEALLNDGGTGTGDTPVGTAPATSDGLVGMWVFTKAKAMGMEIPASMMGTTMSLELKADGKAVLTSADEPVDLDWAVKEDGTVSLSAVGTEIFTLTYDGTTLTLVTEGDSVEMVFEKEN